MEEQKTIQEKKMSYREAKKVIFECEIHGKDSQECKRGLEKLGVKDE